MVERQATPVRSVRSSIEELIRDISEDLARIPAISTERISWFARGHRVDLPAEVTSLKLNGVSNWIIGIYRDWIRGVQVAVYSEKGFSIYKLEIDNFGNARLHVKSNKTWWYTTPFVEELLASLAFTGALDSFVEQGKRAGGVFALLAERALLVSRVLEQNTPSINLGKIGERAHELEFLVESGSKYVGFYVSNVAEFTVCEYPLTRSSCIAVELYDNNPLRRFPITLVEKLPVYSRIQKASRELKKAVERYVKCLIIAKGVLSF